PKATLLEPRHLFFDSQEWLAQWPSLLPSLGAIVFFAPEDNTIGAGVAREILDGLANRISVRFLDDAGHLHDRWRYEGVPNADRFRFVRVVAVVESEG
ncbi:MAG: hypothetical protein ACREM8_14020, partial [Vulcanimicrobiaceae bacterium]